jgi:hypothetical protein
MTSRNMQHHFFSPLRRSPNGEDPAFSDGEIITIAVVGEMLQRASERAWLREVRAHWLDLFPLLVEHSRFNRRCRALAEVIEHFRQFLLWRFGFVDDPYRVVDSAPMHAAHYGRACKNLNTRFRPRLLKDKYGGVEIGVESGMADFGYCASKVMHFFGFRFHVSITLDGIVSTYELSAASGGERDVLPELIELDQRAKAGYKLHYFTDSGYTGEVVRQDVQSLGATITPLAKDKAQRTGGTYTGAFARMGKKVRKMVETVLGELDRRFNLEHFACNMATFSGLKTRLGLKVLAYTMIQVLAMPGQGVVN